MPLFQYPPWSPRDRAHTSSWDSCGCRDMEAALQYNPSSSYSRDWSYFPLRSLICRCINNRTLMISWISWSMSFFKQPFSNLLSIILMNKSSKSMMKLYEFSCSCSSELLMAISLEFISSTSFNNASMSLRLSLSSFS